MPPRGKCPLPAVPRSEAIKLLPRDNLLYLPSPATVLVGTLVRVRVRRCGGRRLVVSQSQPLLEEGRERLRETEEPSAGGDGAEGVGARAPGQSRPVSSAPAAAPTASGSGTWPAFTHPRSQTGLPVWSPDRAQARATHAPAASAGRSDRSGLPLALRSTRRHRAGRERQRGTAAESEARPFWFRCPAPPAGPS